MILSPEVVQSSGALLFEKKISSFGGLKGGTDSLDSSPMSLDPAVAKAVRESKLLSCIPEELAGSVLERAEKLVLEVGELVVEEGLPSDSVFILGEGTVSIVKDGVPIDTQEGGGVIGEMGVVLNQPRTASVVTVTELVAWKISRDDFNAFVDSQPAILKELVRELSEKVQLSHDGRVENSRSVDILRRCVSHEVLDKALLTNKPEDLLKGQENPAAILFFDIKGFSTAAESMEPQELLQNLNDHVGVITESVTRHQGTVVNFIGDAVLAVFNAPIPLEQPCTESLRCYLECQERLREIHTSRKKEGKYCFELGAGLNYGNVVSGAMGNAERFSYTVLGDEVNLSARLEGLTRYYPVDLILSDAVYQHLEPEQQELCVLLDRVQVKGRVTPVDLYGISGTESVDKEVYAKALALYLAGDFVGASREFGSLGTALGGYMMSRCDELKKANSEWPGYHSFTVK